MDYLDRPYGHKASIQANITFANGMEGKIN